MGQGLSLVAPGVKAGGFSFSGVTMLVRVEAPHFVAGLIMKNGTCIAAAPILRWAIGKSANYLRQYFIKKEWKASIVQKQFKPPIPK